MKTMSALPVSFSVRRHLSPASSSLGCWRPEVPKGIPKGKVNPSFHGTAAKRLSDTPDSSHQSKDSTYCNWLPLPGPFCFSGQFPLEILSFRILRNSVCVLIKSRGQQTMAHKPNPNQICPMTSLCGLWFQNGFYFVKGL